MTLASYYIDIYYRYRSSVFLWKVVNYVGNIIIRDESTGQSWSFVPTREGYYMAAAKIDEIVQKGHHVGGDIGRVRSFTG